MKKSLFSFSLILLGFLSYSQQIINSGSEWKYLDDGSNQGTNWKEVNFNDSSWKSGNAQLGFGDGDEATEIDSGHITYYFRKSLNITDPDAENGLKISLLRDDGAVVYINGTEVARSNMPDGNIYYNTYASHTIGGDEEDMFYDYSIPSDILNTGNNVVAVEVHQRSSSSSDVSFDFKMEFSEYSLDLYHKNPYLLYPASNNEMLVVWQLTDDYNCDISWGTDTNYNTGSSSTSEYNSDHQHKYQISGLTPGTKYYYKVSCEGSNFESDFFAGRNDSDTSFSFYAYGDTRSQPAEHDGVAEQILKEISNDPASQTFIVNSGDLVEDGDQESDWDDQFFSKQYTHINSMLSKLPYVSAVGNHEGSGTLFSKYFPYPMYSNSAGAYFSFDYANAHFIVIDQFTDYSSGSTQYNWIVDDLNNSNKPWKFALFHEPGWSAGGHSNETAVQDILQPLFEQYGVSVALNGHNHYYSRAVVNNVQHITTGGGGAPLYDADENYPNIVKTDESYHFLKITITDNNSLTIDAIRQDGSLIERVNVSNTQTSVKNIDTTDKIQINSFKNSLLINSIYENLTADIYDLSGRNIQHVNLNKGKNKITQLNKGIYIVQIKMPNQNLLVKKVLIQ